MPPRKTKAPPAKPTLISRGSGMTAGLELWRLSTNNKIILIDRSPEGRFASDVITWNTVVGLNAETTQLLKDATSEDTP